MKSIPVVTPRTMMTIAGSCFVAGILVGSWITHLVSARRARQLSEAAGEVSLQNKFSAKVVGILDGDTVQVLTPGHLTYAVRLNGIDAPESAQPFGKESTQHLSELIFGKGVNLECKNERDDYGRLVCKILIQGGEDVCLDQLRAGLAWHYKQYQDEQSPSDRETYAAAECTAMKKKIGLWGDPRPEQPQDFRHGTNSPLLFDINGCRKSSEPATGPVVGNSRTHIFQWPGCPYYATISSDSQVPFPSPEAARAAGYRPARNCP